MDIEGYQTRLKFNCHVGLTAMDNRNATPIQTLAVSEKMPRL
jgi:hypothetical protein